MRPRVPLPLRRGSGPVPVRLRHHRERFDGCPVERLRGRSFEQSRNAADCTPMYRPGVREFHLHPPERSHAFQVAPGRSTDHRPGAGRGELPRPIGPRRLRPPAAKAAACHVAPPGILLRPYAGLRTTGRLPHARYVEEHCRVLRCPGVLLPRVNAHQEPRDHAQR